MPRWLPAVLLSAYFALLIHLTLFRFPQAHPSVNLIPLRTITHDIGNANWELAVNTVGNVVAFVPLGFLIPLCLPTRTASARMVAGVALLLSTTIEVAQYFQGHRTSDVDDLILNTVGGLLGWGLLRLSRVWVGQKA